MSKFTKKPEEINLIAEGGIVLRDILNKLAKMAKPGVSTFDLAVFADQEMRAVGGRPSFIGYGPKKNPFPASLCTSVNDVVVHGIPSAREILKDGDILGLDIGMEYKGFYTDTAITVPVGKNVSKEAYRLMDVTKLALEMAIEQAVAGSRIGDISAAIQKTVESAGYSVVRELVGHGVGYAVHEDPAVPCYGKAGTGIELTEDMVLAIEPMVCQFKRNIMIDDDGWTIRTEDEGLAAHFEHTIAVGKHKARLLT